MKCEESLVGPLVRFIVGKRKRVLGMENGPKDIGSRV